MDRSECDSSSGKKPYTKPAVAKVPLAPEEAVLASCKTASAKGPLQGKCNKPSTCRTIGS